MIKNQGCARTIASIIVFSMTLSSLLFLVSCSDYERNHPYLSPFSTVLINLGNKSSKIPGRMEASMPADITLITITVTGAGMAPIITQFTEPTDTVKELTVPSGAARNFTAVAQSPSVTYVGNTVASLPAGQTVSVPIVMVVSTIPPVFRSEGTPSRPVEITVNDATPHVGQVNTGRSYYRATISDTFDSYIIKVSYMTGDVDLFGFGNDNMYTTQESPIFLANYCGRTKDETLDATTFIGDYYFVIDGSHTQFGAAYTVECLGVNVSLSIWPTGTIADPLLFPVGLMGDANRARMDSSFNNYCMALVDPGRQYWINIYEYSDSLFTSIYSTILFNDPLPVIDTTFISPTNIAYFTETGTSVDSEYRTVITANEGTAAMPVDLHPSTSFDYKRANYCMVGASPHSSYYRIPVDPEFSYNLSLTSEDLSITNNINLYVYADSSFENPIHTFTDTISYEMEIGQFPSGYVYVRAEDVSDTGSFYGATFILDIQPIMP